jgi:hypothetical protein
MKMVGMVGIVNKMLGAREQTRVENEFLNWQKGKAENSSNL